MRDISGIVNKRCQLPSLASFPVFNSRELLLIVFVTQLLGGSFIAGELITEKDAGLGKS
jgi:hypothetical protein